MHSGASVFRLSGWAANIGWMASPSIHSTPSSPFPFAVAAWDALLLGECFKLLTSLSMSASDPQGIFILCYSPGQCKSMGQFCDNNTPRYQLGLSRKDLLGLGIMQDGWCRDDSIS